MLKVKLRLKKLKGRIDIIQVKLIFYIRLFINRCEFKWHPEFKILIDSFPTKQQKFSRSILTHWIIIGWVEFKFYSLDIVIPNGAW